MFTFTNSDYRFPCKLDCEYRVSLANRVLDPSSQLLAKALNGSRALLITTPTVYDHYGNHLVQLVEAHGLDLACEVLELREPQKTFESVEKICELSLRYGIGRSGVLVAFGGGVCSDTVTMAASLIRRGIRHVRIPTTLIGQIDAAIGLKGGVNFQDQKNYLGCFHPPDEVFVDPGLLATLSRESLSHGLAEIIKIALVCDAGLFHDVKLHGRHLLGSGFSQPADAASRIIENSIQLMLKQLEENPYENITSERLVDMGHTFSPFLEIASEFMISHGEAVSIDMALTSLISVELGLLAEHEGYTIIKLLSDLGLAVWSPLMTSELCNFAIEQMTLQRRGNLNLVALEAIGHPLFVKNPCEIGDKLIDNALEKLSMIDDLLQPGLASSYAANQKG
jgi:3-dehydroquinate synthase